MSKEIDKAFAEARRDLKAGRTFGPFKSIKEFQEARRKR